MSNARILMLCAMAVVSLASQPAVAHEFDGGEGCHREHSAMHGDGMGPGILHRLGDRLGVSKEQREALEGIAGKHRSDLRQLRGLIFDNGRALRKVQADDPKLPELAAAEGKAIADMIVLRKQIRAEVDSVLTDRQRDKLKMLERHAWHQHSDRSAWHDR
jgi:Spy/CpxP family protein refolding chaperone